MAGRGDHIFPFRSKRVLVFRLLVIALGCVMLAAFSFRVFRHLAWRMPHYYMGDLLFSPESELRDAEDSIHELLCYIARRDIANYSNLSDIEKAAAIHNWTAAAFPASSSSLNRQVAHSISLAAIGIALGEMRFNPDDIARNSREKLRDANTCIVELIKYIVAGEIPGLFNMTDMEKLLAIRNWAINKFPSGDWPPFSLPYPQALVLIMEQKAGVNCGGSATLLARIYNAFGFDAVYIDFGIGGTRTVHAMTAVKISGQNQDRVIIQDCNLGLDFFDDTGRRADLYALTRDIGNGQREKYSEMVHMQPGVKCIFNPNGPAKEYDAVMFMQSGTDAMKEMIGALGKPASMLEYLVLPTAIGYENESLRNELVEFYKKELNIRL